MSPRVQLIAYPDGDPVFASHAAVSLTIDVPPAYSAEEIVLAIEAHLRATYPLATIRSAPSDHPDFDIVWHFYRDGLPSDMRSVD